MATLRELQTELMLLSIADEIIAVLTSRWESTECVVCGGEKWENSPWCRSCSIKVQRLGLMRDRKYFTGKTVKQIRRYGHGFLWASWYDRCTDVLMCQRRENGRHQTHATQLLDHERDGDGEPESIGAG